MIKEYASIIIDKLIYYCNLDLSSVNAFKDFYKSIEDYLIALIDIHIERYMKKMEPMFFSIDEEFNELLRESKIELTRRIAEIQSTNLIYMPI